MKHAIRCEGSPKIFGLSVLPYDVLPGLPNRTDGKLHFPAILVIDGFNLKRFISITYLYLIYISIFLECLLENIGKPVFHRYTADLFGSWMQVRSYPKNNRTFHLIQNIILRLKVTCYQISFVGCCKPR